MNKLFKKSVSMVAVLSMLSGNVATFASAAVAINDGDLVKATGSSAVYLVKGTTLRTFPYSTIYHSWGYPSNYSTVKTVAASDLAAYTTGDPVPFRDGTCFRGTATSLPGFESKAVFCVSDGQLKPVESQNAFFGLFNVTNWTQGNKYVQYIPDDFLSKFDFTFGTTVKEADVNAGALMNGLVVKGSSDGLYYLVQNGALRSLTSAAAFANKIDLTKAVVTAQTKLNSIAAGAPVSSTVETALVTPKTKVEAQQGTIVTDVTKATKLMVSADKTSVEADGATQVTVTAKIVADTGATVSSTANVMFAITSGTGALSATSVAAVAGVATVKFTPSTIAGDTKITATSTGLTAGVVTVTTTANTLAPSVVSVTNQGMRIVNIGFDKALDKDSAQTLGNYVPKHNKSTEVTPTAAKLLADGKTVQLFLPVGFWNDTTSDSIEVKNVQNLAQTASVTTVTKEFTMSDASVPTVVSVEALGSKAMRVTFSEAVDTGVFGGATVVSGVTTAGTISSFRLDDKVLTVNGVATADINGVSVTYPDAGDYTKALISFANPVSVGLHSLTVSYGGAIKDYNVVSTSTSTNAYTMQPAGYVATVSADTNVPQLSSVEVLTQTKARYTFSKPVSVNTASTAFFYNTAVNATTGTSTTLANIVKVSDTVYEVAWDSAISTGNVYFYVGAGVADYSGNTISPLPSSKMLTVASDTAPAISSVSMKTDSDKVIDVYFNKDVETSSATSAVNYVFKKSDGTILTSTNGGSAIGSNGNPSGTIAKYVDNSVTNNKRIQITLGDGTSSTYALPGGTYQLCVSGIKASSGSTSSAMTSTCYAFTSTDKTRPTLSSYSATSKRIVLTFSEAMDPSTAGNAEFYKYGTKKLSEISASVTTGNSSKDVIITIADGSSNSFATSGILSIGYIDGSTKYEVRDANLNILQKVADDTASIVTQTLTVSSDTAIDLAVGGVVTALKVKSTTTLEATFGTKLESISSSEFKIKHGVGSATVVANITNAEICKVVSTNCSEVDETKVIFTVSDDSSTRFSVNTDTLKLYTVAISSGTISSTRNVLNLTLKQNVAEEANAVTVSSGANDIKPILKSFTLDSDGQGLTLSFDGKINASAGTNADNLANDLIVSQVVGSNTTTLSGTVALTVVPDAGVPSSLVKVDFDNSVTLSTLETVTVKTVSQDSIDAIGANGAKLTADTTGKKTAGFVVSSLSDGITAAGLGYGNQTIEVTFNKDLDRNSVYSTWYNSSGSTYKSGSASDSKISGAVSFNANTNKMLVNGVGEFEIPTLQIGGADVLTSNVDAEYTYVNRLLTITFVSSTAPTSLITFTPGDVMTYTPATAIKTPAPDSTPIESGYTSFVTIN